ncbi:hypothetical protein RB653_002428 [Dictyostelium firmibasis]|uniref:Major facilitator superfamily (MFS) profile domain-containing protein n=1 Tax=Dictyostelium firmibasis TaxID=79012 RepID=A0AAN7TNU4_9MYCE
METYENENLLDDNHRNYQVVGKKTPRKYWIGLVIILLSNISLSIISVSIWPYLHNNGITIFFLAAAISGFHTGSSVGRKFFSYYIEKTQSYWLLLFTSLSITLIGDILYAAYPSQSVVLISRTLVGFGTGSQVVLQSLLTEAADPILLKTRISNVSFFTSLAYIVGPAIIAAISSIDLSNTPYIQTSNSLKVLVWFSAFLTFSSIAVTIIGKFIDNSISKHYKSNLNSSNDNIYSIDGNEVNTNSNGYFGIKNNNVFRVSKRNCIIPANIAIILYGFTHYLIFNAGMVLETLMIPYMIDVGGVSDYDWNLTKIALFFIGLGVSCAIVLILSKKIQDQTLLLFTSLVLMTVGYGFMVVWEFPNYKFTTGNIDPPLFRFLLGVTFVAIGFPIAVTSSITLYFEIFSNLQQQKPFFSTYFQLASNLGRLLGPIWAALIFTEVNANYSFLFAMIICLVCLLLLLILKKSIKSINSNNQVYNPKNDPIIKMEDEYDETNQF